MFVSFRGSVLAISTAVMLSGCMETASVSTAPTDMSAALMSRAEQVAGGTVSAQQLSQARAEGAELKTVENDPVGQELRQSCVELYRATNTPEGIRASRDGDVADNANTLAQCSGFLS